MKTFKFYKLPSGALQFVIFIAFLIALLLSGLMLYAYSFNFFKAQSKGAIRMYQQSSNGITYLENSVKLYSDTTTVEDLEVNDVKIQVHSSPWGVFVKGTSVTKHRNKIFKKIGLLSGVYNRVAQPVLVMEESYDPLVLVGNTQIEGNVILPAQGVKAGYINGLGYQGTQLITGNVTISNKTLPKIDANCTKNIEALLSQNKGNFTIEEFYQNHQIVQSFKKPTKIIYANNELVIDNKVLIGNIIVKSDKKIIITANSKLCDIIVVSPEIEIQDTCVGTFQAIASLKIKVGENCNLQFPSALVVHNTSDLADINRVSSISVGKESICNGLACYFQTSKNVFDRFSKIIVNEKAQLKGQVYCQGSFELRGSVIGAVYTKQFVANEAGSTFMNHIYNGVITTTALPNMYGGLVFENSKKINCKWLY